MEVFFFFLKLLGFISPEILKLMKIVASELKVSFKKDEWKCWLIKSYDLLKWEVY